MITDSMSFAIVALINIGVFVSLIFVAIMPACWFIYQAGSVSRMNAINDFYKGLINFGGGTVLFQLIGWDIVSGTSFLTPLLYTAGLAVERPPVEGVLHASESLRFFMHLSFALTSSIIFSGAATGRMRPHIYAVQTFGYAAFAYPIMAFTVWNPNGVLYGAFHDFAGAVVIHGAAASAGLAATLLLKPRIGFNGYDPVGSGREQLFRIAKRHSPHNIPLAAFGGSLIAGTWLGITCGAYFIHGIPEPALGDAEALDEIVSEFGNIARVTLLAAMSAGVLIVVSQVILNQFRDVLYIIGGSIAALVAVSAGADRYDPSTAIFVGAATGAVYFVATTFYHRLNIDDPVSSIASHGFPGLFGVVAAGALTGDDPVWDAAWQCGVGLLLCSIMFVATGAYLIVVSNFFSFIERAAGRRDPEVRGSAMRIAYAVEVQGVDMALHGQDAYNVPVKQEEMPVRKQRAAKR